MQKLYRHKPEGAKFPVCSRGTEEKGEQGLFLINYCNKAWNPGCVFIYLYVFAYGRFFIHLPKLGIPWAENSSAGFDIGSG
jgi:hypothetical protein